MTQEEFVRRCRDLHIDLDAHQLEQFETYRKLLSEWNEKMNLTAITEPGEVYEKHFYDSVAPFAGLQFETFCDVGTGAGFPGIPVKICFPKTRLVLVEPLKKRCRFLEEVVSQLGLCDVEILSVRAEDLNLFWRESFDVVTARAVARLPILLELLAPLVKTGGTVVALKGKAGLEELAEAEKAVGILGLKQPQVEKLEEEEGTRINLYFEKEKPTSARYPRNYGQIKKKPLGGSNG